MGGSGIRLEIEVGRLRAQVEILSEKLAKCEAERDELSAKCERLNRALDNRTIDEALGRRE